MTTQPYSKLAKWYDALYSDEFYNDYGAFIQHIIEQKKLSPVSMLDLACGTGRLMSVLAQKLEKMTGIDNSVAMLEKAQKLLPLVNFYNQDLQSFELNERYNIITCIFDSINYILDDDGLAQVFQHVQRHLEPNGVFIFDFNTDYKQSVGEIQKGEITYRDNINNGLWDITIETPSGNEQHRERLYSFNQMQNTLLKTGLFIQVGLSHFR